MNSDLSFKMLIHIVVSRENTLSHSYSDLLRVNASYKSGSSEQVHEITNSFWWYEFVFNAIFVYIHYYVLRKMHLFLIFCCRMGLLLKDKIELSTPLGSQEIQLLIGDITKLPLEEKVDFIFISAFYGNIFFILIIFCGSASTAFIALNS